MQKGTDMSFRAKRALSMTTVGALLALTAACGSGSGSKVNTSAISGCNKTESSPGVSKDTVSLGATMPLTGSGAAGGLGVSEAAKAYYAMVNDQGGVQGHKINYKALDDQYTPSVAQQAMRQLVQNDKIFAVAGGEGTPNFLATAPYIDQQKVPAVAPYAPSSEVGTMKTPYVYMASVNYITEFQIMTKYVVDHYKPKSVSLVGVSGNVGDDAKAGMAKGLAGTGINVQYIPEQPGTSDFTPIATSLKQHNSDWVFLIITNTDTGQLLQTMKRIGYTPRTAAWPGMADGSYIKAFGNVSNGMVVAAETASLTSNAPKAQEFVKTFTHRVGHAPTKFNELGWVQAEIMTEALKKAPALTRSCLIQALNTMHGFDTGIVPPITFGPHNRQGINAVGLSQIKDGKLVDLTPFQSVSG